ncbi:MAG: type II toxin-antitoxin system HicA family toxin [Methanosarcinales archaeon]
MSKKRRLKYRKLRKKLLKFGFEEQKSRGKGSHRIFYHKNFRGKKRFHPVKCHSEDQELSIKALESIRRAFDLTVEEFYE